MKKLIQLLAVVLAIGAAAQAVTSFVAQAGTEGTRSEGGHEPGP
jgi:hypothetical protein